MNIYDLMSNDELAMIGEPIRESDDSILKKLLDKFKKTTGEFNNASHKFYTVRKAVANELEGEEQEAVKKTSPGEFFNYLKSQKAKAKTPSQSPVEPPKEEPKKDLELRGVTHEELNNAGTVYAIIDQWVEMFYPKYSAEEITEALFKSAMGAFEELPYIRSEVRSSIIKADARKRKEEEASARPRIESMAPSKDEVNAMKDNVIYASVMNDMISAVKNQPRVPGQKPLPAAKMYSYTRNNLLSQYDSRAIDSFKKGDQDKAKEYVIKREIVKNVSKMEYHNWYAKNK